MELEALQSPVSDLQPPASPPDQVVRREVGGCPCGASCPTTHPVTPATQEAQAEPSQTQGLLQLCNETLSWNKKQRRKLGLAQRWMPSWRGRGREGLPATWKGLRFLWSVGEVQRPSGGTGYRWVGGIGKRSGGCRKRQGTNWRGLRAEPGLFEALQSWKGLQSARPAAPMLTQGLGWGVDCGTDPAPGPNSDPHRQAEEADLVAVPVPAAEAETVVTLRELQEALEEEVLTRQSLSRELEAIRTANQNFSRSGLELGEGRAATPAVSSRNGSGRLTLLFFHSQLQEAEVRNRDLEAHVRQLQERMEMLQAPGAAGESLTRSQPGGHRVEMGACWLCGPWGRGGVQAGAPQPPLPSALHAPYTPLFSFQPSRGSPVPGPRIHLPM